MSEQTPSDQRRRRPAPAARQPGAGGVPGRRLPWRLATLLLLLLGGLLLLPGAAEAGQYVDRAVAGLRQQPLYVDPDARSVLKPETINHLEGALEKVGAPMYVAVLPEVAKQETGGKPDQLLTQIGNGVNRPGVYALVAGRSFLAGASPNSGWRRGVIPGLANQAVGNSNGDEDAAVVNFTERVRIAVAQGQANGAGAPAAQDRPSRGGVGAGSILLALVLVGAAGGGLLLVRANRRRQARERQELAEVKRTAQEDLIALGEDIGSLDSDLRASGAAEEARAQHAAAVAAYERAATALDRAARPADIAAVSAALEEGRFAMASAKALLEGRPPPERRPPCFFDTRHGPSVTDVTWAPPGGAPRQVPACAADALRIEEGTEPQTRKVLVGERYEPFYNAPGYYAPWYGGYYGGFGGGGLLTGLLIGSALGGGFGGWGGYGYGAGYDAGYQDGTDQGDGGDSGGDFGGDGDWGGGDFGGDGGGGDFGGGDFGGGDF
ncbi:MAG TPA: hypothetical protein VF486_09935 [Actinomycetes bacterium]